jgi:predicted Zn-dependent protease
MTTDTTAVGGAVPHAFPRRLAVVVMVAVLTVAITRFVDFSASSSPSSSASRPVSQAASPMAPTRDPQAQVARLEALATRDPGDVRVWQQLGAAYIHRAIATYDPAFTNLAGRALDRADALAPGQSITAVTRGVLMLNLHEFARAHDLAAPVHAADPYDADALAVLVDADVELGHYDAAARDLQALLDLRPGLPAYSRASYLRELHGDLAGAEQAMRQALTAGAGDGFDVATVTTFLGDLAFNRGDLTQAAARYRDALHLQPDLVNAQLGRARVLAARGERAAAIRVLQALTERVPLPAAVILLGDLQAANGDVTGAARTFDLERSIVRLQQSAGAVTDLETAVFDADHSDPAAALVAARAAYAARPDNIYTADALAWALVQSGQGAAARPYVAQALRLGTADAPLHYHAAVVANAVGDVTGARAELRTAFARNPFFSFSQQPAAAALAARLGVTTPAAWANEQGR